MNEKNLIKGYFQKNLGDDLFLKVFLERYKNYNFDMNSKYEYKDVLCDNENIKIYNKKNLIIIIKAICNKFFKLIKSKKVILLEDLKKYDNVITIGGSIFMEKDNMDFEIYKNSLFNSNCNNYIIGANFGPVRTKEYIKMHNDLIFPKIKDVCFRDKYSYDLFKELPNVRHASDIVFTLDVSNVNITNSKKAIISVINVNKDGVEDNQIEYNKKIVELIQLLRKKKYNIVLMSFSKIQGDEAVIEQIISMLEDKTCVEKYFYTGNIAEALNVLGDSQIIFGSRFHANILGLLLEKTVIPIAYSDKTINVFNDMNFKGKIFDIRNKENFDIKSLTDEDFSYRFDVSAQIKDANRQFEKLDKIFYKEEK